MPQLPHEEPKSQRSVLQILGDRTGLASKVLLPDSDSEHGHSPVVDPGAAATKLVPQGRGNYQLLGEIARGGMGVILKGHDTDLGRDVAVKVLDGELAKRPEVVQRFIEEAQIGGQLQHPGIVPVYELGLMADERPYFTMKLIKGRTLAALFQQRKNPADNRGRLLAIFESVCQTMAYAHSKGVLHRDLKPANVMVGAFGEVQVVDWGLAKVLRRGGVADEKRAKETIHTVIETVRSGSGSSGSDSMVGSVMGTPAYMAPEQAQGEIEKLDERADVFSLGAILCELLTGKPPYEAPEGESTVALAARAELDPARARIEACDADAALKRLCLDCLMPSRAARPANAEAVANAVHAYITSTEERAAKAGIQAAEERRRRRLQAALGSTVTLALLLGGGGFWWVNRERAKRVDQTRTAVEVAYGESMEFGRSGKPAEALQSARRALALAESGDADAAMLERARNFVAQAEQDAGAAERERTLREKDETLRKQLVDLRLEQIKTLGNRQREVELDAAFAKAFQDYGVDLEGDDLVPALKRIRERAIAEEVALALDDWGRLRRRVHGEKSEKAENLLYLAMDLDPEPGRLRLRQAIFDNDLAVLLELAAPEKLASLAPGSIWVLSSTLWDKFPEHRPDVFRMYDQAQHLYPGDYLLQSIGGNIYQGAGRKRSLDDLPHGGAQPAPERPGCAPACRGVAALPRAPDRSRGSRARLHRCRSPQRGGLLPPGHVPGAARRLRERARKRPAFAADRGGSDPQSGPARAALHRQAGEQVGSGSRHREPGGTGDRGHVPVGAAREPQSRAARPGARAARARGPSGRVRERGLALPGGDGGQRQGRALARSAGLPRRSLHAPGVDPAAHPGRLRFPALADLQPHRSRRCGARDLRARHVELEGAHRRHAGRLGTLRRDALAARGGSGAGEVAQSPANFRMSLSCFTSAFCSAVAAVATSAFLPALSAVLNASCFSASSLSFGAPSSR